MRSSLLFPLRVAFSFVTALVLGGVAFAQTPWVAPAVEKEKKEPATR